MTVEHLIENAFAEGEVLQLAFCEEHDGVLDALVSQRQMSAEQRASVVSTMLFGVVTFMGPTVFQQHNNCPVCVLEGTLERACDEVSMIGRKPS